MQIGKITINPQPNGTVSVTIGGYSVTKAPKEAAAEFIGMCRSMGFVSETDAACAIEYVNKPAESNLEELVNTGFLALITTLNMVHDGIDPDDLDDLDKYDGRYQTAANILETLSQHTVGLSQMLRTLHDNARDDVEKDEPKPVCMCRDGDPYCGTPGCSGLIGKKHFKGRG